ncbi:hypothetical protein RND71_032960 [Anisodus tanguticus]|uniref:Uncharacterized protein n=1 Tax=Anisodus tanguticus TaxID=243964 RepID=A0AAE1R7K8_9SOLA|nr:hypothetical protein RND71_032960 [Anisodus tanguticus]
MGFGGSWVASAPSKPPGFSPLERIKEEPEKEGEDSVRQRFYGKLRASKKGNSSEKKASAFSIKFGRLTEGEHLAAGWPVWLTAIDGWMPLKSNMFQKLEKPYACDSSSLPKYPPNKEIDAKFQEEARRKRASSTVKATETSRNSRKARKALQEPSNFCKVVPTEEVEANVHGSHRNYGSNAHISKGRRATISRISMKPLSDTISETSQMTDESQGDSTILSVPVQMPESSGFAWVKKGKQDSAATRLYPPPNSRSQKLSVFDPSGVLHAGDTFDSNMQDNDDFIRRTHTFKHHSIHRKHGHHELPDSFDSSDQELSTVSVLPLT